MLYQLIINPAASRGRAGREVPTLRGLLDAAGIEYRVSLTQGPAEAVALARDAARAGVGAVVAVGGDGVLNEVVNGLMQARAEGHTGTALGLIPLGRGNDFAFAAGVPAGVAEGCRALLAGRRRRVDIGVATGSGAEGGYYFCNGCGMGFDAAINHDAMSITWLSGFASYAVAALRTILFYYKAPLVRLTIGGFSTEFRSLMVSTMIGSRLGGGFLMAPGARVDEESFKVCLGQKLNRRGVFRSIVRFFGGSQYNHPGVVGIRCRELLIEALDGGLITHADGETLCTAGTRMEIKLLPGALELIG